MNSFLDYLFVHMKQNNKIMSTSTSTATNTSVTVPYYIECLNLSSADLINSVMDFEVTNGFITCNEFDKNVFKNLIKHIYVELLVVYIIYKEDLDKEWIKKCLYDGTLIKQIDDYLSIYTNRMVCFDFKICYFIDGKWQSISPNEVDNLADDICAVLFDENLRDVYRSNYSALCKHGQTFSYM